MNRTLGSTLVVVVLAALGPPSVARAQPAPSPVPGSGSGGDKGDAKSLMASGLKLFVAKDYLGALSVFQTAYARFPSGKILLNIGTTLVKLDRKAEAANAYQGYLDSPDTDPAKLTEVTKVLAALDLEVGVVEVTVTPAGAEVQLGSGEWVAADKLKRTRLAPGELKVRARKAGFLPAEQASTVAAGGTRSIALVLEAEPVISTTTGGTSSSGQLDPGGLHGGVVAPAPRSRFGVLALAHIDPVNPGGAALLGAAFEVTNRITVQAAALLGRSSGAYAGAAFALMTGRVRPVLVAGVPVFFANGARVAIRGAGGVEIELGRHIALIAELGVEHLFNPEAGISATLFIPAVGAIGRL